MKKFVQWLVCCSDFTEILSYKISKKFFKKRAVLTKSRQFTVRNFPINTKGIVFPNFGFNTFMFLPDNENIAFVVTEKDFKRI